MMMRTLLAVLWIVLAAVSGAHAQVASPSAIDIPPWFTETFLDFREDIADAAREQRRLLVYFGQDGCPYCRQLMINNFSQRGIVDKTRAHFVAIALNIWGDRELKWVDGRAMTEKELASVLRVQFTPTILFFDEDGGVVARLNGYYPPQRFERVLDYVANRREHRESLSAYLSRTVKETASPALHDEPFFMRPPYDLSRKPGDKPLAVVFETTDCKACDELHREAFRRPEFLALLARFDVARFALGAATPLTAPDGSATTANDWARALEVTYTPSVVFFDGSGAEAFRIGAYLRPFHLASSFHYVADGAYASEPSFQRYLQRRTEGLRARGERVDLWR